MKNKTDFQIASVSKLITETAAMKLVDEGKLSLDEDINNYLTEFKMNINYRGTISVKSIPFEKTAFTFSLHNGYLK